MPVLNITGSLSPHIEDTVTFNGRLEPTKCNWMKVKSLCQFDFDVFAKTSGIFRSATVAWSSKNNQANWPRPLDFSCRVKDMVSYLLNKL